MIDYKSFKEVSDVVRDASFKTSKILIKHPSALEKRMRRLLNRNKIKFIFQAVFHKEINGNHDLTEAFYIASFYFPKKKIALVMEDSPSKMTQEERDYIASVNGLRTYNIRDISKNIQELRITEEDFNCPTFNQELFALLR
jgi:uncharacterized protein YegJ (DUF2314 family)